MKQYPASMCFAAPICGDQLHIFPMMSLIFLCCFLSFRECSIDLKEVIPSIRFDAAPRWVDLRELMQVQMQINMERSMLLQLQS
jgi:hypothetical protein